MKRWTKLLTVALVAVAAGCSGITTQAKVAPGADLTKYHTYAWYPQPTGGTESIAEQQLRMSLERDLAQKGLTRVTTSPADFLVAYHATTQERVSVTPGYTGYGYWGYGWGSYPDVRTYTEGTLVVDFIDPQTNQVFWRGTAQGIVDHPESPDPKRIDTAVSKIVDKYPMQQMAATPRPAM